MSILAESKTLLEPLGLPLATGVYKGEAAESYIVLVPLTDTYHLYADNNPNAEVQEVRISLFTKSNYKKICRIIF